MYEVATLSFSQMNPFGELTPNLYIQDIWNPNSGVESVVAGEQGFSSRVLE